MRLIGCIAAVPLLWLASTGLAQSAPTPPSASVASDLVAVEIVSANGAREVRLVPRDAIPVNAVILEGQAGPELSGAAPAGSVKPGVARPVRKGLTVSRKSSSSVSNTGASSGTSSGSSTGGASSGGSSRGGSSGGPASPDGGEEGADPGLGSSWRPVGPGGRGMGDRPPTPSGLLTLDKNTGGGVLIKWTDSSTDTIKSVVQRQSQGTGGSWGPTVEFTLGPTARSFSDRPGSGVHRYRVSGVNRAGAAPFTGWATIEVVETVPNPPTNLAVGNMPPRLTWADNSDNETKFEIERQKAYGTQWGSLVSLNASADSTVVVDTPGSGSFRYRLRAANTLGASSFTGWVTYSVQETAPNAPSDLTLSGFEQGNQARITWADNASNETSFEMERQKLYGTAWGSLVSMPFETDTVTALDTPGQGTFRYRIRAKNGAGPSAYTPYLIVTVADGLPSVPGNFTARDYGDGSSIAMAWLDTSNNETKFEVQREKQTGQTWGQGTTIDVIANIASYNDSPGAGVFRYRIRAVNVIGASPFSAWAGVSVSNAPPGIPGNVLATDMGTRRALLSWTYEQNDVTGFDIERDPPFPTETISVDSTVHGYVDSCGPGVFSYKVRSVGPGGGSSYSAWASVTVSETLPLEPTDLVATDTGSQNQIRLLWQDNSTNEAGFRVQRQTMQGDGSWGAAVALTTVAADIVQYLDTVAPGQHRYQVCASNSKGDSGWTPWANATRSTGWTPLVPSSDTRYVYVSSSTGNDSNSGLSEGAPVKTLVRGYSLLRHKYPDWLLLKSGDVWLENIPTFKTSGRSPTEPQVISSYGTGDRPRLETQPNMAAVSRSGGGGAPPTLDNIWVVGVAFTSSPLYQGDSTTVGFFWVGAGSNILIEDCLFKGYQINIGVQSTAAEPLRNVTIRRNVIIDAFSKESNGHSQGIFAAQVDGLNIIENVIDHNGWKEGVANPTLFNHNMYITSDNYGVVVRGNIISRASSHGLAMGCGGVSEDNLFARNALAMFVAKTACTVRNNVVVEGTDIAENPRGFGFEIQQVPASPPTIVEGNIIAHKLSANTYSSALSVSFANHPDYPAPGTIILRNNIVYNWKAVSLATVPAELNRYGSVSVTNNIFSEPTLPARLIYHSPTSVDAGHFTFSGNTYNSVSNVPFAIGGYDCTVAQWKTSARESDFSTAPRVFANATRTASSYNGSLGGPTTFDAMINECRKQSRQYWRESYTAAAINAWVRDGFK